MGVSDGSKTLSLEQVYAEEFSLPDFDIQCNILNSLKSIKSKLDTLAILKKRYYSLMDKELATEYNQYQAKQIKISTCIGYMSGNSGLTEEFIYQMLQSNSERFVVLSSATEDNTMMGEIPKCIINNRQLKVFEGQEGLLVTRMVRRGRQNIFPVENIQSMIMPIFFLLKTHRHMKSILNGFPCNINKIFYRMLRTRIMELGI